MTRRERVNAVTSPAQPPGITVVPRPVLDEIDGRLLSGGVERDRERYRDCDLTGYDLTGSTFTECDFSTVTLHDA